MPIILLFIKESCYSKTIIAKITDCFFEISCPTFKISCPTYLNDCHLKINKHILKGNYSNQNKIPTFVAWKMKLQKYLASEQL